MTIASTRIVIDPDSPWYPEKLKRLPSPPPHLFARGNPDVLSEPCISIIGTRHPTPYGEAITEMAARIAADAGLHVVAGGAIGCDQLAGSEALRCGAAHIMVLGSGADVVYPRTSAALIDDTLENGGAVISLEQWGTQPMRYTFPKRNRVIAALSDAVFIAEAGMPSGTFSTAECAMQIGHEVLVAPGSIFSPMSLGTNYLIANGATCIGDEEALEVAISRIYGRLRRYRQQCAQADGLRGEARRVVEALVASPARMEEISAMLQRDVLDTMELVSSLEVDGVIERLPDGRFAASKETLHARTSIGQNR